MIISIDKNLMIQEERNNEEEEKGDHFLDNYLVAISRVEFCIDSIDI